MIWAIVAAVRSLPVPLWRTCLSSLARMPAHSPNLRAFAERFVLSIKTKCLDRLVPLGEAHLRRAILEYTNHYSFYYREAARNGLGLPSRGAIEYEPRTRWSYAQRTRGFAVAMSIITKASPALAHQQATPG